MFGIGETELLIILLFGFMVFGPDKLPGMGRTIGRALRQFREAQQGFTQVVQAEVLDPAAEAMNAAPTRRTRNRAAELEADSDIETDDENAQPRRKETFAERRARLEAERKAAQEAQAQAQLTAVEDGSPDSDADAEPGEVVDTGAAADAAAEPASEAAPAPAAPTGPTKDSVASLYDISAKTTKSARKQASEEKAAQIAERKAEAEAKAAEKAAAEAAVSAEDAASETKAAPAADADTTGKEDGAPEA